MSETTQKDIDEHIASGVWKDLERLALAMVNYSEQKAGGILMVPRLGGGTRLMLALGHRISDDIDLFIRDPQWIGYLSPRLNDHFESDISGYDENADYLKFQLPNGEIDFIVRQSLLGFADETDPRSGFVLEPTAEVLAKKLFYRGDSLTPRDLFDWRAIMVMAEHLVPENALPLLLDDRKLDDLKDALGKLRTSEKSKMIWNSIKSEWKPDFQDSINWGLAQVETFRSQRIQLRKPGEEGGESSVPCFGGTNQ